MSLLTLFHISIVVNYIYTFYYEFTKEQPPFLKERHAIAPLGGRLLYLTIWNLVCKFRVYLAPRRDETTALIRKLGVLLLPVWCIIIISNVSCVVAFYCGCVLCFGLLVFGGGGGDAIVTI